MLVALGLAAAAATLNVRTAAADDERRPLLKVAVYASGKCGKFADSLPTLVSRTGSRPGDPVSDLTVCVTNDGRRDGSVSLSITERSELDIGCDGQESLDDSTCGSRGRPTEMVLPRVVVTSFGSGELGTSLLQRIGVGGCTSPPPVVSPAAGYRLPDLERPVGLAGRLRPGQVLCAHLVLSYSPVDTRAGVVSQSDRTTWRYVFGIGS